MAGAITSLPPLIEQPPGNNSSNPAGLPGVTYVAAIPTLPQTWTALQTFNTGCVEFAGATSGNTFLNATAIASGVLTLPAATDTIVARNTTDTLTNKSMDGGSNTFTNIPVGAFSHTGTGAVVLSNSPVITTPTGIVKSDVGLGNVANVDTTNAANISSGALPAARLPNPSATTLGGVQSIAAVSHQWVVSISTSGVPSLSQPAFSDISGTVAATQLPNPTSSTLGGIQSLASVASKWINTISTSGVPSATQPAFTDISGQATLAQLPTLGASTVLGSIAGGTPIALSTAQHTSLVNAFTTTLNGSVPNPGSTSGKFLRDDATWQAVAGAGTVTSVTVGGTTITTSGTLPAVAYDASQSLTSPQQVQAIANLGLGAAWTAFTPTVTAASGTFTTVSAAGSYLQIGKLVSFICSITITAAGSASGFTFMNLPVGTLKRAFACSGVDTGSSGKSLMAFGAASASALSIRTYDTTTAIFTSAVLVISGTYEAT